MKRLMSKMAATIAAVAMVLAPVAMPLAASATSDWGPVRAIKTYDSAHPSAGFDHVQFNSFTHTPSVGDERIFFDGKTAGANGSQEDPVNVTSDGQELELRVYVHNDVDQTLHGDQYVAKNTKVRVELPAPSDGGRSLRAQAFISADNAVNQNDQGQPIGGQYQNTVFDSLDFVTAGNTAFGLEYETGSAHIVDGGHANGARVSDSIVTTGALVGYDQVDGTVPACDLQVILKVKVHMSKIEVNKSVRTVGTDGKLGDKVKELNGLHSGDKVEWVINYQNDSDQEIHNVFLRDQLPRGVQVVPGSVKQFDNNFPYPDHGYQRTDGGLFTGTGISVGDLGPHGVGALVFDTKVTDDLNACNVNTPMTNNVWMRADNVPEVGSYARINAVKVCTTTPPPSTPPATLPRTGAEEVAGFAGLSGLSYAAYAYKRSRKALSDALRSWKK